MTTRGRKKAVAEPTPPVRDPRDVETIERLQQQIQELEFERLQRDLPAEETETESNIWDDGSEDVNPFGGGNPRFHKEESCPVYDTDNEEKEYGDEEEVVNADYEEALVFDDDQYEAATENISAQQDIQEELPTDEVQDKPMETLKSKKLNVNDDSVDALNINKLDDSHVVEFDLDASFTGLSHTEILSVAVEVSVIVESDVIGEPQFTQEEVIEPIPSINEDFDSKSTTLPFTLETLSVLSPALQNLHGKVLVPIVVDQVQGQALAALQVIKVIEGDVQPGDLCTQREYARWLVSASSALLRNTLSKVYNAMYIENVTELSFDDITPEGLDFSSIQGLAEVGLIVSKLSRRDMNISNEDDSLLHFCPKSPLSHIDKINPDAWPALIADLSAGENGIVNLAFGYTRVFQPNKPVTNSQAAIALATVQKYVIRYYENDLVLEESKSVLYNSLRKLQLMALSVDTLKATTIGKSVNLLRKHSSKDVRDITKTLIESWKNMVDEWVMATKETVVSEATPELINPSFLNEEEEGLPSPPLDNLAFFTLMRH
ncbi:DNA double-strand break repair Rad50 ATPase [Tanacetum coccineum]